MKTYEEVKNLMEIKIPEAAYVLGLLWADGYLKQNSCSIECVKDDLDVFLPILLKTGVWKFSYRHRQNRREQGCASFHSKIFREFLEKYDYNSKGLSANKILSIIPDDLKVFWYRGFSDGDGCFHLNCENGGVYSISGPYDQNWDFISSLFQNINIRFRIRKRSWTTKEQKINKCSNILIHNQSDIERFGDYLYNSYLIDNIGLKRKYDKFLSIKNRKRFLPSKNYFGVRKNLKSGLFESFTRQGGKTIFCGIFEDEKSAAKIRDLKVLELNLKNVKLNF